MIRTNLIQRSNVKGQGHQAGLLTAAFTHRQLQRRGQSGNVLSVGNCCYVAVCRRGGRLGGARRYGARRGGEGRGHIVSPRAQLVKTYLRNSMADTRLSNLALLSFESKRAQGLDLDNVVDEFDVSHQKRRIALH